MHGALRLCAPQGPCTKQFFTVSKSIGSDSGSGQAAETIEVDVFRIEDLVWVRKEYQGVHVRQASLLKLDGMDMTNSVPEDVSFVDVRQKCPFSSVEKHGR